MLIDALKRAYPGYKMNLMCRVCRGNADATFQKFRCPMCKLSKKDYEQRGLEAERTEMEYLYRTWAKCKSYSMISTGIKKLDFILTLLFGVPHTKGWRDYKKFKGKLTEDNGVVLRTVALGRGE